MAFTGFNENGDPTFDTKENCIAWSRARLRLEGEPDSAIMCKRDWAPSWFAHLVQMTPLEFLAWCEEK